MGTEAGAEGPGKGQRLGPWRNKGGKDAKRPESEGLGWSICQAEGQGQEGVGISVIATQFFKAPLLGG